VTPFDERGEVDLACVERLAAECLDAGAAGVVALATTGEATSLTDDERTEIVAACARVCQGRSAQLLVGAGTNDTRTTVARHAALSDVEGVAASLAVVPYYVRPSEPALVAHFHHVAERSPVPVVVYNIPYRTGRGLGGTALLELAASDNVIGVKQAVGGIDVDTLTVLADSPDGFAVLGGDDPYLFPVVLMGGAGAISASAHLATERFVAMIEHGLAGHLAQGRDHAEALLPLVLALFAEPSPAVIKAVLHAAGRIPTPDVRMPLSNSSNTTLHHANDALRNARL
jgi:4-hydroxy-tetrahydrodipicolinate synthase